METMSFNTHKQRRVEKKLSGQSIQSLNGMETRGLEDLFDLTSISVSILIHV